MRTKAGGKRKKRKETGFPNSHF